MGKGGEAVMKPAAVSEVRSIAADSERTSAAKADMPETEIYGDGGETLIPPPPHTFQLVQNMHSHPDRKRTILEAHPDIEDLYGYDWRTKWLTLSLAVGNLSLAAYVSMNWRELPWWGMFLIVYCLGAPMNHACSMIIHDCCHDLTAATPVANRWVAMLANLPLAVPSAMSFRRYHLEHHSHLGVVGTDMDLPPWLDIKAVGNSTWRKLLWTFLYAFSYALRPYGWGRTKLASEWELVNGAVQIGVDAAMVWCFGPGSILYLLLCTLFSFGIHPFAVHFIHEHFLLLGNADHGVGHRQETFSYYGSLNPLILNVGYHNEHHDFAAVPWTRLPEITAKAPEFYKSIPYHTSIWTVVKDFFFNTEHGPHTRLARTKTAHQAAVKQMLADRKAQRLSGKKAN